MDEKSKNEILLDVKNLQVSFFTPAGEVKAVDGISYEVRRGEVMGIVGESGSGKSVEALSVMGLLQRPGKVIGGSVRFMGEELLTKSNAQMNTIRGKNIAMIFQNPTSCLNPLYTIGNQLSEALRAHNTSISRKQAHSLSVKMLEDVGISNAQQRMKQYPHQLSGGMCQRVLIAMALICNPELLIADEPTTALDVTTQAQILELIKTLHKKNNMGMVFISHDLGLVGEICDNISVMYAGKIVEQGSVQSIFEMPAHPYTSALIKCIPQVDSQEDVKRLYTIEGAPVDVTNPPEGCAFAPRCEQCMRICLKQAPRYTRLDDGHHCACWLLQKQELGKGGDADGE